MYLYSKTEDFIFKKDKEANNLEQKHRQHLMYRNLMKKQSVFKKDSKFDALKRKLGGT